MITVTLDRSRLQLNANGASATLLLDRAQTFTLGTEVYRISKQGVFNRSLALWEGDILLASAQKENFFYGGDEWKLSCTKFWSELEYTLCKGYDPVGFIRSSRGWVSALLGSGVSGFKEIHVDLPEKFPMAVQFFLAWLACYLWSTDHAGTGGD